MTESATECGRVSDGEEESTVLDAWTVWGLGVFSSLFLILFTNEASLFTSFLLMMMMSFLGVETSFNFSAKPDEGIAGVWFDVETSWS